MTTEVAVQWWEPPKLADGTVDLVQAARDVCMFVNQVGTYLLEGAEIVAEMRDQLPRRGPLTELHAELTEVLRFVEAKWSYADDALLTTATLVGIEGRHE